MSVSTDVAAFRGAIRSSRRRSRTVHRRPRRLCAGRGRRVGRSVRTGAVWVSGISAGTQRSVSRSGSSCDRICRNAPVGVRGGRGVGVRRVGCVVGRCVYRCGRRVRARLSSRRRGTPVPACRRSCSRLSPSVAVRVAFFRAGPIGGGAPDVENAPREDRPWQVPSAGVRSPKPPDPRKDY